MRRFAQWRHSCTSKKISRYGCFPEWKHDQSGRVCAVDLLCRQETVTFVSLHAPNDPVKRRTFFTNLGHYDNTSAKIIVGEHLNSVMWASDCPRGRSKIRAFQYQGNCWVTTILKMLVILP